jgi:hypothetical protein
MATIKPEHEATVLQALGNYARIAHDLIPGPGADTASYWTAQRTAALAALDSLCSPLCKHIERELGLALEAGAHADPIVERRAPALALT